MPDVAAGGTACIVARGGRELGAARARQLPPSATIAGAASAVVAGERYIGAVTKTNPGESCCDFDCCTLSCLQSCLC